jgi:hypothetical protein
VAGIIKAKARVETRTLECREEGGLDVGEDEEVER